MKRLLSVIIILALMLGFIYVMSRLGTSLLKAKEQQILNIGGCGDNTKQGENYGK